MPPRFANLDPCHAPHGFGAVFRWSVIDRLTGRRRGYRRGRPYQSSSAPYHRARLTGAVMTSQNCPADGRKPVNPDRARELLTTELKELDDRAAFAASSAAESASGDLAADEAGTTQHPADFGTEVTNRMESEGLVRTIELQRRRVQDALDRLDGGTYGRCAVCGTDIDDERLEARPEVATCREHADALPVG